MCVFPRIACTETHESNGPDALRMVDKLELAPHPRRTVEMTDGKARACYKRLCVSRQLVHFAKFSLVYLLPRKALIADRALERLLVCVGCHMSCQMFMTGKGVRADLAGILPRRRHRFKTIEIKGLNRIHLSCETDSFCSVTRRCQLCACIQ